MPYGFLTNPVFRFFCSLKLAVVILSLLTIGLAVGTVMESKYDTPTAGYYVYRAFWFNAVLVLLGVNIFCVALSRIPWKKRHIPFLLAHLGILLMLVGSWFTQKFGVDANMILDEGRSSAVVEESQTVLDIRQAASGEDVRYRRVIFPWMPPDVDFDPVEVSDFGVTVTDYLAHADPVFAFGADPEPPPSRERMRPAIRIRLEMPMMGVNRSFWLWSGSSAWTFFNLGPLSIRLVPHRLSNVKTSRTLLELQYTEPASKDPKDVELSYRSFSRKGFTKEGSFSVPKGKSIETGWAGAMGGVKIQIEEWIPHAKNETTYKKSRVQYGPQAPRSAIKIQSGENSVWLGIGDRTSLHREGAPPVQIAYLPRLKTLPFALHLERFSIDFDLGTRNPAAYSSLVRVKGKNAPKDPILIQMNEPLDFGRYTFYQASYIPGEPRPTTSILTVNFDPGRWLKYIGSILIVLGSAWLFIVKYRAQKRKVS